MYLQVQALVLRVTDYNERDALLTLLTRRHGKLTVKARGLRRKNSPLIAPCQLLAFSEFTLFEYRGMYTINEATSIELFRGLQRDLTKLSLGSYFAQAAEVLSQEDMPNPELQSLLLNCLYALSRLDLPESQGKAVFELRLMCLAGYEPDLSCCAQCGAAAPDEPWFSPRGGAVYCAHCRGASSSAVTPLLPETLAAMRHIVNADPKKIFSFTLGDAGRRQLAHVCEDYTATQLERGFASLDYWKKVKD